MRHNAEISDRAVQAAIQVAHRIGIDCTDAAILHHSQHVSIRVFPSDVVARVRIAKRPETENELRREIAVARHLVAKGAPAVGLISDLPAGPYFHDGFGLTLWRFVEHVAADPDNQQHMASAAEALRRIHDALADFPGELPSFRAKIDQCRRLLEDDTALTALPALDRIFLHSVYRRVIDSMNALPLKPVPIHGDAGVHNVLITSEGACYSDFEDVSLGPREWDIGFLPEIDLPAFEPVDRDILSVLSDLRSLCVSVWCWDKYHMPEKREAADYHLTYLKERFAP